MKFIDKNTIKMDKIKTELDDFTFTFCKMLECHAKYVIISGYVSILFGRARATEDVDIFIEKLDQERFYSLFKELKKQGYTCITADMKTAFENLQDDIPIRFALGNRFIPNIEVKFAKKLIDKQSLVDNLKVITAFGHVFISHIEPQIAFKKVCLGSDKDLEDAAHLEKDFKGHLDNRMLEAYTRLFKS